MLKLAFQENDQNHSVWLIGPKMMLGSRQGNDIHLTGDGIAPVHAELRIDGEDLVLLRRAANVTLSVNDKMVEKGRRVSVNDTIYVGNQCLQISDPKQTAKPITAAKKPVAADSLEKKSGAFSAWSLKANHPLLANKIYNLKPETLVGRAQECDIFLATAHLSRRHALLTVSQSGLFVKDLGSANGTFLNGQRITEARVKRGDELRFDTVNFGVLGPTEDLDKTTIRPSLAAPVAAEEKHYQKPARVTHATVEGIKASKGATSIGPRAPLSANDISSRLSLFLLIGLMLTAAMLCGWYVFGLLA